MVYLKEKELEQALREDMESTIESYGGDSTAEDVICYCYDSMLSVIKQLAQYKEEKDLVRVMRLEWKFNVTCPRCGSLLQYEDAGVKTIQTGMNEYKKEITCPVCGKSMEV